eukprot:g4007.t1
MEQFKGLVLGGKEEVLDYMREQLPKHEYDRIVDTAWKRLRQPLSNKAEAEFLAKLRAEEASGGSPGDAMSEPQDGDSSKSEPESDSEDADSDILSCSGEPNTMDAEAANMMEALAYMNVIVGDGPIKYDAQDDSEYNKEAKAAVETIAITRHSIANYSYWLPWDFAKIMYDCPHNSNLLHTTNSGYVKYYDGQAWIKKNACDVSMIFENWQNKVVECFNMLVAQHGNEWLGTFEAWYLNEVMKMFNIARPDWERCSNWTAARVKKEALIVIDNTNARLKGVERRTGRRVNRVLDENDYDVRGKQVLRSTTWDELMSM